MRKRAIDKAKSLPEPKVKVLETNFADMKAGKPWWFLRLNLSKVSLKLHRKEKNFRYPLCDKR